MNADHVTRQEFEISRESQKDLIKMIGSELKEISLDIKQTNILLKEDISITKGMIKEHIIQYNNDKEQNSITFRELKSDSKEIKDSIQEREGVYSAAKKFFWAIGIILSGVLIAFGSTVYAWLSR
jgi:hypothetical protein